MSLQNMAGPFRLTETTVKKQVTETSPGNFVLGYYDTQENFVVCYVGRSDDDLRARILAWTGNIEKYTHFHFAYADSVKEAFIEECHNFHDYGMSEHAYNTNHPYRPEDTRWRCPRCPIFQ